MTEEILGAITSDKVETDNTNFATLKADQTCEEALVPRDNAVRQLNWQVTLEKGSVYNPQEDIGIYAREVDCKYGVQVDGTVFGSDGVSIEHGGSVHSAGDGDGDPPVIGARILGSVISEGSVEVTSPDAKMDDWEGRPVSVYGDVLGGHVSIEEPTVVYGNISAEQMLWIDAPTLVFGDVRSGGSIEATDLFAFSGTAHDDISFGKRVVTVNPVVRSETGTISMANDVFVFDSATLAAIQDGHDIDHVSIGPWLFEDEALQEGGRLVPADVIDHGEGELATRAWRTVSTSESEYRYIESLLDRYVDDFRRDPPDIDQFRYAGLGSIGETDGPSESGITIEHQGEGDVVFGDQDKQIDQDTLTKIDNSVSEVTETTTVHDERTTIEDSVVNRSDIGNDDDSAPESETDSPTTQQDGGR